MEIVKSQQALALEKENLSLQQKTLARSVAAAKAHNLPEFLTHNEIQALISCADGMLCKLLILVQFRAGLRISEAIDLERKDFDLTSDYPTLRVRRGKGNKARLVPLHPELRAALQVAISYGSRDALFPITRFTGLRWVKAAYIEASKRGLIMPGKKLGTHTFRHSAARHWLANGIQINHVQNWLGHARLETTLIYLKILPDPRHDLDKVP